MKIFNDEWKVIKFGLKLDVHVFEFRMPLISIISVVCGSWWENNVHYYLIKTVTWHFMIFNILKIGIISVDSFFLRIVHFKHFANNCACQAYFLQLFFAAINWIKQIDMHIYIEMHHNFLWLFFHLLKFDLIWKGTLFKIFSFRFQFKT